MSGEIWKLHTEFPVEEFRKPSGVDTPTVADTPREWIEVELPAIVTGNINFFWKKHSKELFAFFIGSLKVSVEYRHLTTQLSANFWKGTDLSVR